MNNQLRVSEHGSPAALLEHVTRATIINLPADVTALPTTFGSCELRESKGPAAASAEPNRTGRKVLPIEVPPPPAGNDNSCSDPNPLTELREQSSGKTYNRTRTRSGSDTYPAPSTAGSRASRAPRSCPCPISTRAFHAKTTGRGTRWERVSSAGEEEVEEEVRGRGLESGDRLQQLVWRSDCLHPLPIWLQNNHFCLQYKLILTPWCTCKSSPGCCQSMVNTDHTPVWHLQVSPC